MLSSEFLKILKDLNQQQKFCGEDKLNVKANSKLAGLICGDHKLCYQAFIHYSPRKEKGRSHGHLIWQTEGHHSNKIEAYHVGCRSVKNHLRLRERIYLRKLFETQ